MTQEDEVARLFDRVGGFDHLVSTAGAPPPGDPIDRSEMDVVRRFVDSKLLGAVLLVKHAMRGLKPGGSITFTSGINKDLNGGARFPQCVSTGWRATRRPQTTTARALLAGALAGAPTRSSTHPTWRTSRPSVRVSPSSRRFASSALDVAGGRSATAGPTRSKYARVG